MTWVVVLLASLLIAGLRFLMRGRAAPPDRPASDASSSDGEPKA